VLGDLSSRRILAVALAASLALLTAGCGGGGGGATVAKANDGAGSPLAPVDAASSSDPGDLAARFLQDGTYRSLVVEVDHVEGRAPNAEALDALVTRLTSVCRKPQGATIVLDDPIPAGAFPDVIDADALESIETTWRDRYADAATGVAVLYVLCVPGAHEDDTPTERALGMAFGGSSLALFLDSTDRGADVFATTAEMRAMILMHEAGHLLGLVNNGLPMMTPHEDPDHAHHCEDAKCLLAEAPNLPRLGPEIGDPAFSPLCPHCLEDLEALADR
jgi:hypothetical protein